MKDYEKRAINALEAAAQTQLTNDDNIAVAQVYATLELVETLAALHRELKVIRATLARLA